MTKTTIQFPDPTPLTRESLNELSTFQAETCITLMMPTHALPPERETNPILFKNLVAEVKEKWTQHNRSQHFHLLENLEDVYLDRHFWNHQHAGLALFINDSFIRLHQVPIQLPELTMVSNRFHIKPLYRYFQENDRVHVLVLNLDGVKVYEGNQFHMKEIQIEGKMVQSMKEALGDELTDDHFNTASATGNGSNKQANQMTGHVVHGYMEKSQEQDIDAERFFRHIDQQMYAHFSSVAQLPLLLAAPAEHHSLFRGLSKNEYLLEQGIQMNAAQLSPDELKNKMWETYQPIYEQRIQHTLEKHQLASSQHLSQTLLEDIALDAIDGKIEMLLVEEDRIIKGRINEEERTITYTPSGVEDVLDDLSALVLDRGGKVMLLPADRMPSDTGAATINRY
jgi:hypothetical protein